MRKKRRRRQQGDVELNLAAMLDMAFQLLTFFILTFKPAPIEGQVSLRLPPPKPVTSTKGQQAGADTANTNPVEGVNSLVITVTALPSGGIEQLAIGEKSMGPSLTHLEQELKKDLNDPGNPFDQVIIQVGSDLRYDELMRVIDVCTKQTYKKDGKEEKLTKLSFVELPKGAGQ